MDYVKWIGGGIVGVAWLYRVIDAAIGMPSVANIAEPEWDRNAVAVSGNLSSGNLSSGNRSSATPRVSIIVPARNEERDIEQSLTTLLELDYGNYEVIAVNDRSTDRTGEIMERLAQTFPNNIKRGLRVIHHRDLPAGWLGKTHAMWTATNEATGDWLLFTDSDVLFKPSSVPRALPYAEPEH